MELPAAAIIEANDTLSITSEITVNGNGSTIQPAGGQHSNI